MWCNNHSKTIVLLLISIAILATGTLMIVRECQLILSNLECTHTGIVDVSVYNDTLIVAIGYIFVIGVLISILIPESNFGRKVRGFNSDGALVLLAFIFSFLVLKVPILFALGNCSEACCKYWDNHVMNVCNIIIDLCGCVILMYAFGMFRRLKNNVPNDQEQLLDHEAIVNIIRGINA